MEFKRERITIANLHRDYKRPHKIANSEIFLHPFEDWRQCQALVQHVQLFLRSEKICDAVKFWAGVAVGAPYSFTHSRITYLLHSISEDSPISLV
jgi:hypothetical protein